MTRDVIQFGERVAIALGEGPCATTLSVQRERFVESASLTPRHRLRQSSIAIAVASAAAVVLLIIGLKWQHNPPMIHATWNGASVYGPHVFEAATNRPQSLEFSEGSQVLLEPDTSASLASLSEHNAELTLNDGHILASIRKHTGITWTIAAGPYRVRVVGTRFTVDWDRERHQLRVAVREGRVKVNGGDLPGEGLVLDAGGKLERNVAPERPETAPHTEASTVPSAPMLAPSVSVVTKESTTRAALNPANNEAVAGPTWVALSKQGKYKEALTVAEKLGFDALVNDLGEDDLLLLANAARYSGDTSRSHQALLKLRDRFAGRRSSALAAFYLARFAVDVEHRPTTAIQWFETFLNESPRGDLAALARAHLMSLWLNDGKPEKARQVARDYIMYHPNGAQIAQARSLVQSTQ